MTTRRACAHKLLEASLLVAVLNCNPYVLEPIPNAIEFRPRLSDYGLFQGSMSALQPRDNVFAYELNTELFTDYANKQRLLRLPEGTAMIAVGDGLPSFPDGTMLAKSFFYPRDVRRPSLGRRIIETRLLIKHDGRWNAATYLWNSSQDDAQLGTDGRTVFVEWTTGAGVRRSVRYEVPSNDNCSNCHRSNGQIVPIGPQLRNLNDNWSDHSANQTSGQLLRLAQRGLLTAGELRTVKALPPWDDVTLPIADRARAYMDVNCAHCHRPSGWASQTGLRLEFERPFVDTRISSRRDRMVQRITATRRDERMPRIGTTIHHDEGVALLLQYLESLRR